MTRLGPEMGRGSRSVVYHGSDAQVVKVAIADTPDRWLRDEHRFLTAARLGGAPGPADPALVDLENGRLGLALQRVNGTPMEQTLCADPGEGTLLGKLLAQLQLDVWSCRASFALPSQHDRVTAKLRIVASRHDLDVRVLLPWLAHDRPLGLCHGDLHPRNVLLVGSGPVLVDWFDASIGTFAAETARTLLHIGPRSWMADDAALDGRRALYRSYLDAITDAADFEGDELDRWCTVQLVARVAEGVGLDDLPELRERLARW